MTAIVLGPSVALVEALTDAVGDVLVIDGNSAVDDTMWQALTVLQTARASMKTAGGRIVVVLPTIGLAGAACQLDYATAVEGIRALAKSAARQWGSEGIGVNMVAAPVRLFKPDVDSSHLTAAAVPDDESLMHSVVETVGFLLRADVKHLTGETIVVDGGSVMAP
jgi:3-oxoacyl-[acyl-carrier protein] reductase